MLKLIANSFKSGSRAGGASIYICMYNTYNFPYWFFLAIEFSPSGWQQSWTWCWHRCTEWTGCNRVDFGDQGKATRRNSNETHNIFLLEKSMFKPMSALMWTVNRFNNSNLPISWSSPMPIATYLTSYLSAPFWTDVDSMRPRQRLCFMMQIQSWCFKAHWKRRMVLMPWRPRVGWHGNARAMHWQCSAWEVVVAWKPKCPAFQIGTLFTNCVGQPCPVAQNFSHSPRLSRHWFQKAGSKFSLFS